jgi:hypothetical protein
MARKKEMRLVSKTFKNISKNRPPKKRSRTEKQEFRCRRCGLFVGPTLGGGKHRNHCPYCLHSRHVDGSVPGDRSSDCGGLMAPIGAFTRPKGEHAIVHRCLTCGFERYNRIAADDDFEAVLELPNVKPRSRNAVSAARSLLESLELLIDAG